MLKRNRMKHIVIKGARQNNLKNISVEIPRNEIVVFTGVSGSGKSSLVFETITAEAQRQLYDTFSTFARSRLPKYEQADYDAIHHLSPVIVLEQKRMVGNARSNVGTVSEISAFLRLLFSRIGTPSAGMASNNFSFNSPEGMCPSCGGIGNVHQLDVDKIIDWDKSINEGGILFPDFKVNSIGFKIIVFSKFFDLDKPLKQFSEEELNKLFYADSEPFEFVGGENGFNANFNGVLLKIKKGYLNKDISSLTEKRRKIIKQFITSAPCQDCKGSRLKKEALACLINGKNIHELSQLQLNQLLSFLNDIENETVRTVLEQLRQRLTNLINIGVGYLNLSRETRTLSGGESQRIQLAKQLGNSLTEMIYVLDEPSVGLHPRDVHLVNDLLIKLRDAGNTVLVVEHDPDVIKIADCILDVGPKAGVNGGEIVFKGSLKELKESGTLTGRFLKVKIPAKKNFRVHNGYFSIENAKENNLKNVSVKIPRQVLTCITGVAGSGKSSLIHKAFLKKYPDAIIIDQKPVGKSIRSNPATYTGVFNSIRNEFSKSNKNVNPSLFSFNADGACNNCKGLGFVLMDLAFLDPVKSTCELCQGNRYKNEVYQYLYKDHTIVDVLNLTINQAISLFDDKTIVKKLTVLQEVGLGYLKLGQSLSTLSGGECQRVKLASELHKEGLVYILDEPTTGLHMSDIARIVELLNKLVDKGNSLIVIEHNLDVINNADWIIDIGPEGGIAGGEVIFEGTPKQLQDSEVGYTSKYLKSYNCTF